MSKPIYLDASKPESERVKDLLSRMTLDEKLAQIAMGPSTRDMAKLIDDGKYPELGYSSSYCHDDGDTDAYNRVQKYQIENTRLGIPMLLHGESLHGFRNMGATMFPQAIGLGATFDPELVGEIADVAGREAYISGVRQTYAPNLDLSKDPRWGRVEENYGEDPYLTSRLGVSYIKALQKNHVASSPKHYLAHGTPEGGINIGPVHAGMREVRETMLEPFAAAFVEAKAMSVMPAYSELDGIPIHASRFAMTDLLHDELGFDGYSVSDFGAMSMLHSPHRVARNLTEAGIIALHAGIDHEAGSRACWGKEFCDLAREGKIDLDELDEAVRRTLRIKFRLGLFEDPYSKPERMAEIHSDASVALARRAAQESIVLLENDGILPLDSAKRQKIALVGPHGDGIQLGDYSPKGAEAYSVTLKTALESIVGAENVAFAKGANIASTTPEMLDAAVKAVEASDVAIIVLGDNSSFNGGVGWGDTDGDGVVTCGEGFDNSTLILPDAQMELFRRVTELGRPTILLFECGRPYCIGDMTPRVNATVWAWYPGEQGGNAICDILFGKVSPSGRLPISFPRSVGTIPCYYNYKPTARGFYHKPGSPEAPGRDYVFDSPAALYKFGYGLSYTTFAYSDLAVKPTSSETAELSVTVKNTGNVESDEVVQIYLRQHFCPTTPFVRRLRKFARVTLKPGEEKQLTFTLTAPDFSYIDVDMKTAVGSGKFTAYCGELSCEFEMN